MTEQVHHQTRKAADVSLAKKEISPESHAAILAGELKLEEARNLGRDAGPDTPPEPESRTSKSDRSRECMCGCGKVTKGRFAIGHDQVLHRLAREYVRGERELTDEQLAYVEESGKLDRARTRVAKEEAKRQEKAEKQSE